jgi:hypothetical protein
MTDDLPEAEEVLERETDVETSPRKRRWKWPLILLSVLVVLPALLFAVWSWIALTYTYSSGERAGYVQKFSEKGWVCKTWEGELSMVNIPGAAQERWQFSVRNDTVAAEILRQMGNRVALTYEEHRGVPTSCFGETSYFVEGVRRVEP